MVKFNSIGAAFAPLPKFLANKKAIVNVRNSNNRCFGYAVLSALKDPLPGHMKNQANSYKEIDFQTNGLADINYPIPVEAVPDLEEKLQMSINIFSFYDYEGR